MSECVSVCARARAFLAVIELLLGSVLKVGFYIMKWNVTYKCVCVLNFYFASLSLRHRTIFYIGTLLILMVCVCVCVCCLLYTSPSPRDISLSRMPSSA